MKKVEEILTRVEGEGSITLIYEDEKLKDVRLKIFEPPRFIESILRGKDYFRIIDITARICGICPVAYQISGVYGIEDAFGVSTDSKIEDLRRLFYFGEWIHSHSIHVFFLHLPDFFNKTSIFEVSKEHPEFLKIGLIIKNVGSKLIEIIGGRSSHPVSPMVGGFTKFPDDEELKNLLPEIEEALDLSIYAVKKFSMFKFPECNLPDIHFLSVEEEQYPILKGEVVSNKGLKFTKDEFDSFIREYQVEYSTAKRAKIKDKELYLVGPVSRFNNSFEKLTETAQKLSLNIDLFPPVINIYKSILVRMIEIIHSLEMSKDLIKKYKKDNLRNINYSVKSGSGTGISEAPRGILWHKYSFDSGGKVISADIIPPTSQNQDIMELSVKTSVWRLSDLEEILITGEKVVRTFDPCISCATHFLKVDKIIGKKIS
ncbi:Ni/Fe hydrogenase subunit alpha [Persephonella sp.]